MSSPPIDLATGTVTIDLVDVDPHFTRADFLASPLGGERQDSVVNEPHRSWQVAVEVGNQSFLAVLYFTGERLTQVHLVLDGGRTSTSWADWSEEEELAIKAAHDRWLREECGVVPPQEFEWGRISSIYDAIGGFSLIVLEYHMGET